MDIVEIWIAMILTIWQLIKTNAAYFIAAAIIISAVAIASNREN